MKYCTHCGAEIMDEAVLCIKCGCWTGKPITPTDQLQAKINTCALVGFILTMVAAVMFFADFMGLLALAGMIVSIVGLVQLVRNGDQRGNGFAITGVSVGACLFLFGILYWIAMLFF